MSEVWLPALVALFVWWFGTGAVLFARSAVGRAKAATGRVATGLALLGVALIWATAEDQTPLAALTAFVGAIALWAWHELSFLTGAITGPRKTPCPPGAKGWRRFRYAAETLIHHELTLAVTTLSLVVWLWHAPNPTAAWTFAILWGMRLSTKFNIFFGAPNVAEELLPDDLRYLATYFARRGPTLLFPISLAAGIGLAVWLASMAFTPGADEFARSAHMLAATLTALGVLEHAFLALPMREAALWRWFTNARRVRAHRASKALTTGSLAAPTMRGK